MVMVVLQHLQPLPVYIPFTAGYLGVDIFFVLSGFVITRKLVSSNLAEGGSLRAFYVARAVRLLPALLVTVPVALVAHLIYRESGAAAFGLQTLLALTFTLNWLSLWPSQFTYLVSTLGVTWSLSVEEHFYLMWPAALRAITRRTRPGALASRATAVLVATIVISALAFLIGAWKLPMIETVPSAYFHTEGRLAELAMGCLIALQSQALINRVPTRVWWLVMAVPGSLAVGLAWFPQHPVLTYAAAPLAAAVATSAAILLIVQRPAEVHRGFWPWQLLGRISYELYLLHVSVYILVAAVVDVQVRYLLPLQLGAAIAAATATCLLVSEPLVRWNKTRQPRAAQPALVR